MNKKLFCIICFLWPLLAYSQKYHSFRPGELWLDNNGVHINAHGGGFIFYNNKYYWFGEHKIEGEKGNYAQVGVHCYSSSDLYNWNDEGIALKVSSEPNSDIAQGCILERPKVIYNPNTKKFVMWFHLEPKGKGYTGALSGIATANKITGPYTFIRSTRTTPGCYPVNVLDLHKCPVKQSTIDKKLYGGGLNGEHPDTLNILGRDFKEGQMARDMQLFVDDNGKAYHIYSSEDNLTLQIAELSDDYLSHTGKYIRIFPGGHNEAPAIFKKDGIYWMITSGCTGWEPNKARLLTATSILGEWKQLPNPCVGENADKTFGGQSTYVLPLQGTEKQFIFMADSWRPESLADSRYIWLPVRFDEKGIPFIEWVDRWKPD